VKVKALEAKSILSKYEDMTVVKKQCVRMVRIEL
jgi:hypothetical protein